MRLARLAVIGLAAGALLAGAALAGPSLTEGSQRSERRQQAFRALHGSGAEASKAFYHGEAEGKRLSVSSFGSSVTGDGPHGRLSLSFGSSTVSGRSGDEVVSLHAFSGWVTGRGPHGHVSLSVMGRHIHGSVGDGSVSVSVMGGWATGTFRGQSFSLSGFDDLNPLGVAALLGSL